MSRFLSFALTAIAALTVNAASTWTVGGVEYTVDTLFHNQVGPGTTTTSLWFHNATSLQFRVFYCTIDLTNPYVSLHAVNATDKTAGNERVSTMAQRKSQPGAQYFAGVNGDFYFTSGSTGRGTSMIGTPVGTAVGDGVVYRAINNAVATSTLPSTRQANFTSTPSPLAAL